MANYGSYKRSPLSPTLQRRVWERDNADCRYCGFPADEIDHVIPYSAGGRNVTGNLVLACKLCNNVEGGALLFESFEAKRDYILSRRRYGILRRYTPAGEPAEDSSADCICGRPAGHEGYCWSYL